MQGEYIFIGIIAVGIVVYLGYALLHPERL